MAKKKDGITDLTKHMMACAKYLPISDYKKATSVIYALLNGVTYQYPEFGPQFLRDAKDLRNFYTKNNKDGKSKNNVVKLKLIQGTKDVNNLL
tara:strand:+ start:173 stop:451 length:279 start_codon:yes stop_codon:yes gene_type:complete